jgi:hypothetical protein
MVKKIKEWLDIKFTNIIKDDVIILYDGIFGKLLSPLTKEASCKYGKGTKWCTSGKNENMFFHYKRLGNLYIWIEGGTGNKYQFQFKDASFMDEKDEQISDQTMKYFIEDDPVISKFLDINKNEIFNDIDFTYKYAKAIGKRDPIIEKIILDKIIINKNDDNDILLLKALKIAVSYAKDVIKGRWNEFEKIINDPVIKATNILYEYYIELDDIEDDISDIEEYLYSSRDNIIGVHDLAVRFSIRINKLWSDLEKSIIFYKDIQSGVEYVKIKGRWLELEDLLNKSISTDENNKSLLYQYEKNIKWFNQYKNKSFINKETAKKNRKNRKDEK